MRIKRYIQFIKESSEVKDNFWELTEDDIMEFFIEFEDAGYSISVELGFEDINDGYFTEKINIGESLPSYYIIIKRNSNTNNEDLTDSLKFAIDIISDKLNTNKSSQLSLFQSTHENYPGKITLLDSDSEYDIKLLYSDHIKIQGGTFWSDNPGGNYDYEFEGPTYIFIRQKDKIQVTPKMLCDFYNWEYQNTDGKGNVYINVELDDMVDRLIDSRDIYGKYLKDGFEDMWDNHDPSYYTPDDQSLFRYTLDKDNIILMIKSIIMEMGGLEEVISHIGDECDDEIYNTVKNMSEDELVDFLSKERYNNTLNQISTDSDIKMEVKELVADYESNAHFDSNVESLISAFDDIVGEEFTFIKKEIKDNIVYQIMFKNEWMPDHWTYSDMKDRDIYDLFDEYCGQSIYKCSLSPNFSDWGNVDSEELNNDIRGKLTRFISN